MSYIDKRLIKASKEGNKLVPEVGDVAVVKYLGYDIRKDERYNKTKYVFKFKLPDGSEKVISTSTKSFLGQMAYIVVGSVLEIERTGEGMQSSFEVKVKKEAKVSQKDTFEADDEEEVTVEEKDEEVEDEDFEIDF